VAHNSIDACIYRLLNIGKNEKISKFNKRASFAHSLYTYNVEGVNVILPSAAFLSATATPPPRVDAVAHSLEQKKSK
jgi:hypothetical protein